MSKKFNMFQSQKSVSEDKISFNNAKVGDYALVKSGNCLGTWKLTSGALANLQVQKYGVQSFNSLNFIYEKNGTRLDCTSFGWAGAAFKFGVTTENILWVTDNIYFIITSGSDATNPILIDFMETYFTKEE